MSSVFKGIKKIFKKVVDVVKKVAPIALAVGALVFTGGAALGLTSMAGGWSAAAGAVTSAIGASGTVGAALTGAITQAGYGALAGGVLAEATGGKFSEGAKKGAAAGAITGGLLSGASHLKANMGGATPTAGATPGIAPPSGGEVAANGVKTYPLPQTPPITGTPVDAAGNVIKTGGGLLSKAAGFVEKHPVLTGNIIQGVGAALVGNNQVDAIQERYRQVRKNYAGTDPGTEYAAAQPGSGLLPRDRFSPNYYGSYEYQYNPQSGRIEKVPVGG